MSLIQPATWEDLGWVKLGASNEPMIKGVAAILRNTGIYDIKSESDYTWFKLHQDNVDLLKIVTCISQENYRSDSIYQPIIDHKPGTELIHSSRIGIHEKDVGEFAEKIRSKQEPFHKHFYTIETLVMSENYDKLPLLIKDIIAPFFFRDYPDGRIHFIVIDDFLMEIFAHIRIPYICSVYGFETARAMSQTTGVRTYDQLTGALADINVFVSILSSFFFPKVYFIGATRLGSCILFQLDTPFEYNPKYPYDVFDLIRESRIYGEYAQTDIDRIEPGGSEERRLAFRRFIHERKWTANELEILVRWFIQKTSQMIAEFINSARFIDIDTRYASFPRQFNFLHTIQRILGETAIILTERDPRVRKPLFFELLDKYGRIIEDLANDSSTKNDADNFKNLLRKTNYENNIKPLLKQIPEPFGSYFSEAYGQMIFDEIHRVIIEDRYLAYSISGENVRITSWDESLRKFVYKGNDIPKEDYVVNMLRTVRNSHHGYLGDKRFEKYLAIHSGSTPDHLPDLSQVFLLSLLSDPSKFLDAGWV